MSHFCPQCGQPVTELNAAQCLYCGATLATVAVASPAAPPVAPPPAVEAPLRSSSPVAAAAWNPAALPPVPQLPQIPFEAAPGVASFFATVKGVLTHPVDTLQGQRTGEGLFNALAFFLIIQIPVQIIGQLWNWAILLILPPMPPGFPEQLARIIGMLQHPSLVFSLTIAVAGILLGLPFMLLNAGVIHFFLRLLGGGKEGYRTTVKSLCYSHAPLLLAFIPVCGGVAGGIWALILQFVLVGAAHRELPTKGVLAVLFYYLLVACCTLGAIAVMVVAILGSVGALAGH